MHDIYLNLLRTFCLEGLRLVRLCNSIANIEQEPFQFKNHEANEISLAGD